MTRKQALMTAVMAILVVAVVAALVIGAPIAHTAIRSLAGESGLPATATPLLPATNQLSVALGSKGSPATLALSTNEEIWQDIAQPTGARGQIVASALQGWNPPDVRLHFGFRGGVTALPEATPGKWDFANLDATISQLRAHNTSFFLNVRTAPPWMFDSAGQLEDGEFPVYANYLARIVGWYNKGGFTDEQGTFHKSDHIGWIHTWEIWNEPKSGAEIPVPDSALDRRAAPWMQPTRFAALYDLCSAAMRAVDPTVIIGGPALGSWPYDSYLHDFMQSEHAPVAFFSFHFYAATSATETDADSLGAITGDRFLNRLKEAHQILATLRPGQDIPIWVDELGFNEASFGKVDVRGSTPMAYAFTSDAFATAEAQNVALLSQFELVSNEQLGIINYQSNQFQRPYWFYRTLAKQIPAGSTTYPVTVDHSDQLVAVAAIAPDGGSLNILVGNIAVAKASDVGGPGVRKVVRIALSGLPAAVGTLAARASVWRFDPTTPITTMPKADSVPLYAPVAGQTSIEIPLAGYSASVISIPLTK